MSLTMVYLGVGKGDDVPFGDDVVHAHEGGVIAMESGLEPMADTSSTGSVSILP